MPPPPASDASGDGAASQAKTKSWLKFGAPARKLFIITPDVSGGAQSRAGAHLRCFCFIAAALLLILSLASFASPLSGLAEVSRGAAAVASTVNVGHLPFDGTAGDSTAAAPTSLSTTGSDAAPASYVGGAAPLTSQQDAGRAAPGATPDYLVDTAVVTMASGDTAGKMAVAWLQSLRDSGTQIPNVLVMLSRGGVGSADCQDSAWKSARKRSDISCQSPDTIAEEIISEKYVQALTRLGAIIKIIDPIPDTEYMVIPGGRQTFWGMA